LHWVRKYVLSIKYIFKIGLFFLSVSLEEFNWAKGVEMGDDM